jgi:hypothetical protein
MVGGIHLGSVPSRPIRSVAVPEIAGSVHRCGGGRAGQIEFRRYYSTILGEGEIEDTVTLGEKADVDFLDISVK